MIKDFSFAMIWGGIIGTYSSVCLAVPILMYLNVDRGGVLAGGSDEGSVEDADTASKER